MSVQNSLVFLSARVVSGFASMGTMVLVARYLGPVGYGQYSMLLTMAGLVASLLTHPLSTTLSRHHRNDGDDAVVMAVFGVAVGGAALMMSLAIAIELIGASGLSAGMVVAAVAVATLQSGSDLNQAWASARAQVAVFARAQLIRAGGVFLLVLIVLRTWPTLEIAVVCLCLGLVASLFYARSALWQEVGGCRVRSQSLRFVGAISLPFVATSMLSYVVQAADRWVLVRHLDPERFGAYTAVADLSQQSIGMVFSAVMYAWYPRMVSLWNGDETRASVKALYEEYLSFLVMIGVPALAIFLLLGPTVAALLFKGYSDQPSSLWLGFGLFSTLLAFKSFYLDVAILLGRSGLVFFAVLAFTSLCSLLAVVWGVSRFGAAGGCFGLAGGQALGCVVSYFAGRGVLSPRVLPSVVVIASGGSVLFIVAGAVSEGMFVLRLCAVGLALGMYFLLIWISNPHGLGNRAKQRLAVWCGRTR